MQPKAVEEKHSIRLPDWWSAVGDGVVRLSTIGGIHMSAIPYIHLEAKRMLGGDSPKKQVR